MRNKFIYHISSISLFSAELIPPAWIVISESNTSNLALMIPKVFWSCPTYIEYEFDILRVVGNCKCTAWNMLPQEIGTAYMCIEKKKNS